MNYKFLCLQGTLCCLHLPIYHAVKVSDAGIAYVTHEYWVLPDAKG
jgi:hypothetical protein